MSGQAKRVAAVLVFLFGTATAHAQAKVPPETRNAALRYWLAFADIQDPPTDKATAGLLEKTAAGEAPWDEAKLGSILDKNETAIWRMQRATKLPECDWGLEYDLGPRASIAYVPKARVLARLNTIYGMRLAAKGDSQKAVDTWLAGIRFSQHLANGGSLIFSLVAKMGLISNFHALTQEAESGALSAEQKRQIEAAAHALPDTGLDWGQALRYEEDPLNVAIKQMSEAASPATYYQEMMGRPAPGNYVPPTSDEITAFHKLMASAEKALRLQPDAASEQLITIQESAKGLHPFFRDAMPSLTRVNDARIEVQLARAQLLKAVAAKQN
jgi:hypothetical protein